MSRYDWNEQMRKHLRKCGRDRMSTDAWDVCEDLLTRVEELEVELADAKAERAEVLESQA